MIAFLYDKTIVMSLITKRTERSLYLSSRITDGNFVFIIELLALQFITGNDKHFGFAIKFRRIV